jgi:hypothetical protein
MLRSANGEEMAQSVLKSAEERIRGSMGLLKGGHGDKEKLPDVAFSWWVAPSRQETEACSQALASSMNVGARPAAEEKPGLPLEIQLEQPCTLPR